MAAPEHVPPPAGPEAPPGEGASQWLLAGALGLAAVATVGLGLRGAPTTDELLERARTAEAPRAQVRAMHALILRGYWESRPLEELTAHLDAGSDEAREFVTRMHGSLLRPR